MTCLFVTGAGGFIGTHLLRSLDLNKYDTVYALSRQPNTPGHANLNPKVNFIQASLFDSSSYARYLSKCETVIHLAAVTGKAKSEEYFKVNSEGTSFFVEQCKQAGVRNLMYVSTIAVKYPDISHYWYAQSKASAERIVRDSYLNYVIVRPTIVIGKNGATWKTLSRISRMPLVIVPGGGLVTIQPIHIEDLVKCLVTILSDNVFCNEIFELGGSEQISFEELLKRIHFFYSGKIPRVSHVPIKPLNAVLSFFESRFPVLPVTTGQLSAFSNDGTVEENRLFRHHISAMKTIDEMLRQVIADG